MTINIKYFGSLTDITGCSLEELSFEGNSLRHLLKYLYLKYPSLAQKSFQVAQGQEIIGQDSLMDEKEIALLPPFSGG